MFKDFFLKMLEITLFIIIASKVDEANKSCKSKTGLSKFSDH